MLQGTIWAFLPAIVAILLALLTKQVYVSLFTGVLVGALLYSGGNPLQALGTMYTVMSEQIGGSGPILVFLVVLGIFVILMQKSGGSRAYGEWAQKKITSKKGAVTATAALGCLIFVDDYFNCLTVGSVMRPVTDKFKVSHAKLAWIIDSTAAPVCIIAPISSWAAAVSGEITGNGLVVFMQTIPFNIYAILTIVMIFIFGALNFDFGKMRKNEIIAETTGDLDAGETELPTDEDKSIVSNPKGKVRHLVVPVIILIVCCIGGMIYSGFFYNWGSSFEFASDNTTIISSAIADGQTIVTMTKSDALIAELTEAKIFTEQIQGVYYAIEGDYVKLFVDSTDVLIGTNSVFTEYEAAGYGTTLQSANVIEAFSNCDAGTSLAIGSTIALIIVSIYLMVDKVIDFKEVTASFTQGFKTMVPAILILTFAWSISGIMGAKGGYLDAQAFVEEKMSNIPKTLEMFFPAIFFVVACFISFSTGTSWGTFGVLIPIITTILGTKDPTVIVILSVAATLGGAVFGDHVSPISDTTILASTGGNCNHVDHVKTQLPYAAVVAVISFIGYVVAGVVASLGSWLSALIMWAVVAVLAVGAFFVLKFISKKQEEKAN